MSDNFPITPGSGGIIAGDNINGVIYQRVKLSLGQDGEASDASDGNPVPVKYTSAQRTATPIVATSSGTIAAGARSVSFAHSGVNAPVVQGVTLIAGIEFDIIAPPGDTLGAITYNPGASGTLVMVEVR